MKPLLEELAKTAPPAVEPEEDAEPESGSGGKEEADPDDGEQAPRKQAGPSASAAGAAGDGLQGALRELMAVPVDPALEAKSYLAHLQSKGVKLLRDLDRTVQLVQVVRAAVDEYRRTNGNSPEQGGARCGGGRTFGALISDPPRRSGRIERFAARVLALPRARAAAAGQEGQGSAAALCTARSSRPAPCALHSRTCRGRRCQGCGPAGYARLLDERNG